jgi:hypothetical protein
MEPVARVIRVRDALRALPATGGLAWFIETSKATFWCRDPSLEPALETALRGIAGTVLLSRHDLRRDYGIAFADDRHGQWFLYARPGSTFYPNEFSHPVAGRVLGLMDHQQRPRLRHSIHRGEHGYLPDAPCEAGFALVAIDGIKAAAGAATLVDVAPSLARLLQVSVPAGMTGRSDLWETVGRRR